MSNLSPNTMAYSALKHLRQNTTGALTAREVSQALQCTTQCASASLNNLVHSGHVTVALDPAGRKIYQVAV